MILRKLKIILNLMTKNKYFLCFPAYMKKWLVVLLVLLVGCQTAPSPGYSYCAEGYKMVNGGCIPEPDAKTETNMTVEVAENENVTVTNVTDEIIINQTDEFVIGFKETKTKTNPVELLPELFERVDSYGYTYDRNKYAVVGNYVRVFYNQLINLDDFRINTIYFDNKAKTAVGKCIPDRYFVKKGLHTQCKELGDKEYEVDFDKYYRKTPEEYLNSFSKLIPADIIETQRVGVREAYLFIFRNGEQYQNFWADSTYGMPLKIQWYDGTEIIKNVEFRDVVINDYSLEEVVP